MYRAKREGKGCYRVFEAAMHTAAVERMNLEQELRTAIRDGALTVHYQPIVDTSTGHITSFEALAGGNTRQGALSPRTSSFRWPRNRGSSSNWAVPCFSKPANRPASGTSGSLRYARASRSTHHAFNSQTQASSLHVADALARAELDPSSLIVEVTESILASESGHVIATLDELRRTGIRVAIDDFGTGYSSFAALAELPIDILKIDKRFIDNLVYDDQGRGFVNAIMQLAHTLHLETTAEGVEQLEQRDVLAALGCTHIQGYFFSPPMPGDETHEYLARGGVRHRPALI